jgi:hypothetical protein
MTNRRIDESPRLMIPTVVYSTTGAITVLDGKGMVGASIDIIDMQTHFGNGHLGAEPKGVCLALKNII